MAAETVCDRCGREFSPAGLPRHREYCTTPERPEGREAVRVYPRGASVPYVRQAGQVIVRWRNHPDPDARGYIVEANVGGLIVEGAGHYGSDLDAAVVAGSRLAAALAPSARSIPLPFPRERGTPYVLSDELVRSVHRGLSRVGDYELSEAEVEAVLFALEEIYGGD